MFLIALLCFFVGTEFVLAMVEWSAYKNGYSKAKYDLLWTLTIMFFTIFVAWFRIQALGCYC